MDFLTSINLRPTSRSREIVLDHALFDLFPDPMTVEGRERVPTKPLPLAQALANVDRLHERCGGEYGHVCNLPRRLQRFDLYDYLLASRAARAAT